MTSLALTDRVYGCADRSEIWDQPVEHPAARSFLAASSRFLRSLGEASYADVWMDITALVRRCRRLICTVPLPFSSPLLELHTAALQLTRAALQLGGIVDAGHAASLTAVAENLLRLAEDECDPLGECTREFLTLDEGGVSIVVLHNRAFIGPVKEAMARYGVMTRVGTYSELATAEVFTSAAVVGPPGWMRPSLLNAPRAEYIAVVHYNFFREYPAVEPLLFAPAISTSVVRPVIKSKPYHSGDPQALEQNALMAGASGTPVLEPGECMPDEEIHASFRLPPSQHGDRQRSSDRVVAFAAALADGSYVLLPRDADARILTVQADGPCPVVTQAPASLVGPGDCIALRSRSHHQDLMDRADALLGPSATSLRSLQAGWKSQLLEKTRQHPRGIRGVADDLRRRGARTANVSYWISTWCIRPRSQDDFTVVMSYLARSDEAATAWGQLRLIDRAHRSAGQRYATNLQQALTLQHVQQMTTAGWCEVRTAGNDSGTLIARIEHVLPDRLYAPVQALCRLRPTEDV
ncbi:hypothetical protein ACQEV9_31255 [Streptomyces chartreusis]|uniref:hypothetical protein n=1 Tax=Streptomyces chartreusis TaxID=1969 RepID=UPI003D94D815